MRLLRPAAEGSVAFDLPWPWGGEKFELRDIRPLNYIVGPLGSGKTRLAHAIAEALPEATFLGLERSADEGTEARVRMGADPALKSRVDRTLTWLIEEGAVVSAALTALLVALESEEPAILVVDMVEQGLDQASQEALIAHLRYRPARGSPALLAYALQLDPGFGRRGHRRGDHPVPRQPQPADLGRTLSRRTRS